MIQVSPSVVVGHKMWGWFVAVRAGSQSLEPFRSQHVDPRARFAGSRINCSGGMMPAGNGMGLWIQISFGRCWFDQARLASCWCSHDRSRLVHLLAGTPDRLSREPAEPGPAIAAHARRLFDCARGLPDE